QPALATELLGAGPSPPSRQPPRGPLSSRVSPHARPSPLRSFEQAVDPIQTDSVSAAESLRVFRSGAPDAVVRAPHDTPRQVQHPRLSLQRRAPSTLRRHLARAVGRFAVLLTADLAAFAVLRELYRSVGEGALLGAWIGHTVQELLPAGYLDGWQYALALVLGVVDTAPIPSPAALGGLIDLPILIHEQSVETVVICGHLSDAELHDVVDQSITAGCHVFSVPRTFEVAGVQPNVIWKRGQP